MTCIVAIAHKGKVYMGGDGAGTDSSYGQVRRIDKKVFKNGDYQVGESHDKYNAVGCGEDLALGALYVTASRPPKERITLALNAACHHSAGCAGPYTILST